MNNELSQGQKPDEIHVRGCFDCPFAHLTDKKWECAYPDAKDVIPIARWGRLGTIPGLNCPLYKSSIIISLKHE
jgi:hypothetical protein